MLLLLALYVLGGVVMAGILVRRRRRRPLLYVAAVLILLVSWSGGALAWKETRRSSQRAVILTEKVDALSGPAVDYTPLFTVHEGLRVRIRSRRGNWVHILLRNGLNGWVPADSLDNV